MSVNSNQRTGPMATNAHEILISGAGLGGLTAALALQSKGFKVRVLEQAPALGDIGAGITLAPNATRVLDALGLEQELAAVGTVPSKQAVKHFRSGDVLVAINRQDNSKERYGAAYYVAHRADVHGVLVRAVLSNDPSCVLVSARVADVQQNGNRVTAVLADGRVVVGDVLIAADGVKSVVRDKLFSHQPPRFAGYMAWRGLVPTSQLPPGVIDPPADLTIAPGRMFARYLLRSGTVLNYVAIAAVEAWQEEGWTIASDPSEVQAAFAEFHAETQVIMANTKPEQCHKWGLFEHAPLTSWVHGRVALLGDAAHAMTPFMGQGAAMALEDAMILARCLSSFDDVEAALKRYQGARLERTTMVARESMIKGKAMLSSETDTYGKNGHRNEESLGLFEYNAITTPI
jgi:salicylate hydroxylase